MAWAPDYITLSELKAFLRIGDTGDDVQLAVAITAASRAIDRCTNRQFGVVASVEERQYTAEWNRRRGRWVVPIDDLMTVTGLVVTTVDEDGTLTGTITAYDLEPRDADLKGRPWELLVVRSTSAVVPTGARGEMATTGLWGWTAVPTAVDQATYLQASRFHARRNSPYGVAGSPDDGSELRLLARVDPDVAVSLGPYRRWWAAA